MKIETCYEDDEIRDDINFQLHYIVGGVRLSYNSNDKSDSDGSDSGRLIGTKDLKLLESLSKKGNGEDKFLRCIHLLLDITAPRYWWQQFDTYKIGVTTLSQSTMHTLKEDVKNWEKHVLLPLLNFKFYKIIFDRIDTLFNLPSKLKDLETFQMIKSLLPEGWLQRRIVSLNYAVLKNIYKQRKNHKLPEWAQFCKFIETLPQSQLITNK